MVNRHIHLKNSSIYKCIKLKVNICFMTSHYSKCSKNKLHFVWLLRYIYIEQKETRTRRRLQIVLCKSNLLSTSRRGKDLFLPPANEVWGKVIFSQASVILFTVVHTATPAMHAPCQTCPHHTHPLPCMPPCHACLPQDTMRCGQ